MKSLITTALCLLFSVFLITSAHAESIYESDYATYNTHLYSNVTDIINSDIVLRVGGNFNYISYPVTQDKTFQYIGGGGNVALSYCTNGHCFGVDQTLATIYTYKDSPNHFLGSTHLSYRHRTLFINRLLLEYGPGIGVTYASNSDKIEEKVFRGNGFAVSIKLYFIATVFITRDIGIGLNITPSLLYELGVNNDSIANPNDLPAFFGVDVGIHLTYKY